jgi:type IV pilus assembly protein PilW
MERTMKIRPTCNEKGITLIELLVALVIAALTIAGIYRVFIAQTKTYAVQDQVVEVQQSIRGAAEVMLRDLRMTGFDDDNPASAVTVLTPIVTPVQDNSITISYEYYNRTLAQYQLHTVTYSVDGSSQLVRTLTTGGVTTSEVLLPNVNALTFTYGIDANTDGTMDDRNADGLITDADYADAATVATSRVVAIRLALTARPERADEDIMKVVTPRTLVSAVTPRNLCLR